MITALNSVAGKILYPVSYAENLISCPDGTRADPSVGCVPAPENIISPESSLLELILEISGYIAWFAGGLAVIFLLIGAIQYALAAGDESKMSNAKQTMLWSILGLAISVTAAGIIQFVLNIIK